MNLQLMFFTSILDSLLILKKNNKFHLFKLLISCCQDQLLWDRQQIMLKAVLWSDNLYRGLQKPIYYVVLGFNPFFTKTIQNGSQTIRARKTRLWRFGLLICGWGLRFWGWGFRILGLGQVLGTNSHGFGIDLQHRGICQVSIVQKFCTDDTGLLHIGWQIPECLWYGWVGIGFVTCYVERIRDYSSPKTCPRPKILKPQTLTVS